MRTKSKPNTGKPGISAANCYRSNIRSAATDLEALVDGYNIEDLIFVMCEMRNQIAIHGDCQNNREVNLWLNARELPSIRKQHNPKKRKVK